MEKGRQNDISPIWVCVCVCVCMCMCVSGRNDTACINYVVQTSNKTKKFFVKTDEFWVPSKSEHVLFDQLHQKKFREIMKDQLKYVSVIWCIARYVIGGKIL